MSQYVRGGETIFETPENADREKPAAPNSTVLASMSGKEEAGKISSAIDCAPVSAERSFEVFQGKLFSLPAREYSLADSVERRVESPLQRFIRLKNELNTLKSDLDLMTSDSKDASSSVWAVLQTEASRMIQELQGLAAHPGISEANNPGGEGVSPITSDLRSLAVSAPPSPLPAQDAPRSAATTSTSIAASLEQRLHVLETLLGSSSNILDVEDVANSGSLKIDAGVYPLVDTLHRMEKRILSMDEAQLEKLRTSAAALRAELEATNREKVKNSGAEHRVIESIARLDDLYEKLQRVDGFSQDLPTLIVRLKTLQHLHASAGAFNARFQAIEKLTQNLEAQVACNSAVLRDVKEGLASNIATMMENIELIDKRITEVQSRTSK